MSRMRREVSAAAVGDSNNTVNSGNGSFSGLSGSFGAMPSHDSIDTDKDMIRTRTRTVKLNNVDQRSGNVDTAVTQLRPFVSQLLLYPDCADDILESLSDIFQKLVDAAATSSDASCIVQTMVRWLSPLTLNYKVSTALAACDLVNQIVERAKQQQQETQTSHQQTSPAISPTEIANMISLDIVNHLEDESLWYPSARVCLAKLY